MNKKTNKQKRHLSKVSSFVVHRSKKYAQINYWFSFFFFLSEPSTRNTHTSLQYKRKIFFYLASSMPSYSASCLMKLALGRVILRFCLTKLYAFSRDQPFSFIAYAITVEAERLTPILQWTKHLDWFFLQSIKQNSTEGVKSHVAFFF